MKQKLNLLFNISSYNFFIAILLLLPFFIIGASNSSLPSVLFLIGGLLSSALQFTALIFLLGFILSLFLNYRFLQWCLLILNSILFVFIITDFGIFRIYNFHFNAMVIGMITTPGFWDSVSLGFYSTITLIGFILFFIFIEYVIIKKSTNKIPNYKKIWKTLLILILIFATERITFAIADLNNYREITVHAKAYPLYFPLTIRGFAKKVLKINVNREKNLKIKKSSLHYPKKEIALPDKPTNPYNIIIIAIDSWRFDMLNQELTPNIYDFSKKSLVFDNHFSGGNSTRFGIFSLFYAIYGYYWHDFLADRKGPVFIDVLKKLGYNFKILSATLLTFPEFRKTVFIKIPESIEDEFKTKNCQKREKLLVDRFIRFRENYKSEKPYFSFIFFDGPHARCYPDKFAKFKAKKDVNYLIIGKRNITKVKNAYKNSVYYDDYLVGKLLRYLEKKGDLKNSIVIITGDHGEEFYELGHFGHNNTFDRYQVKPAFVMYIPGIPHKIIDKTTTHYDVVPTLFSLLGIKNSYKDYSFGINMLDDTKHDYVVSCNWSNCAIIDNESTLVFSYETHKMFSINLYDNNYKPITDQKILAEKKKRLFKVVKELTYFYK